jgi:PadR family transcriptional regulator, regulatory protein PadR
MIGGYVPNVSYLREPARAEAPLLENLRHELRRGSLVVAALGVLRMECHGYALRQALAARGLGIEPGTLYPLLRRLESQGLLSSQWRAEGKRRKRFYSLTAEGRWMLERLSAEWKRIDLSLSHILRPFRHEAA